MDNFRQYIKEAHLKDDDGYEFELTEYKLKMYFYIFNDKYFNNKLKSIPLYCVNVNTASNRNELGDLQTKIDLNNNKIINYCIIMLMYIIHLQRICGRKYILLFVNKTLMKIILNQKLMIY